MVLQWCYNCAAMVLPHSAVLKNCVSQWRQRVTIMVLDSNGNGIKTDACNVGVTTA
jgi:hypothetical protein